MQSRILQSSSNTGISRRTLLCAAAASLFPRIHALAINPSREQTALTQTLRDASASAAILHQQSGRILAIHGNVKLADTPGSILKPLLLFEALKQNLVAHTTTVFCRRDLRIGNRSYPCTHPQSNISFTAQEALAYSCNTWFASLALRFSPSSLVETFRAFHLYSVIAPASPEQTQLLALGLASLTTSPSEIAAAYRILGNQLSQPFAKAVADGLRDSVSFGMAHNADASGIDISGKTGTADSPPRQPWSHGWFAGLATIRRTPLVISLYLPQGNGADAAQLARNFFIACNKTTA
jgi:cell division protein FtsI/penicillin-binding protein 2